MFIFILNSTSSQLQSLPESIKAILIHRLTLRSSTPSKHFHNHTKPQECQLCGVGGAEAKDLNRHMWAHHPDEARALKVPKDEGRCDVCGYSGRKDNVKRHRDTKGH